MKKRKRGTTRDMMVTPLGLTAAETKVLDTIVGPAPARLDNGFRPLWPAPLPVAVLDETGLEVGRVAFYPPIRCVIDRGPPCGWCWYCLEWAKTSGAPRHGTQGDPAAAFVGRLMKHRGSPL